MLENMAHKGRIECFRRKAGVFDIGFEIHIIPKQIRSLIFGKNSRKSLLENVLWSKMDQRFHSGE